MNERMQELAESAKHAVEKEGILLELVLEKFAELIVRECAKNFAEEPDKPFYGRHVAHQIKQHFGIE